MEINELHIKNFGKFSDRHFFLHSGIHVFYGENEYGKSTIYAFIKAMLFGLERGRGRGAQHDEFSKYEPWENPNYYAGVMRFSSGGRNFRLERLFDRYSKSASLVCEDDGEELSLEDGDLDVLLGGLSKENFENTLAIGQIAAKPGQELSEALKNYAANYYETGDNMVDLNGALETLRLRRKSLEQELKKLKGIREHKKREIYQRMDYVTADIEKMDNESKDNQKKLKSLKTLLESHVVDEKEDDHKDLTSQGVQVDKPGGIGMVKIGAAGIVLGALGSLGSFIAQSRSWLEDIRGMSMLPFISGILVVAGLILCGVGGIRLAAGANRSKQEVEPLAEENGENKELETEIQRLEWEQAHIQSEWKEKKTEYQNLQEELDEVELPGEKAQALVCMKQALLLAEEKLLDASEDMSQGFGSLLNENASRILERVTAGKYTKLFIDEKLNMVVFKEGRRIPIERVSKGTIEQIYFSLRMAASQMLCEEPMPIIADEAFAYYDEKRLKSTIKWLREQSRQVIIFTCQKREAEIVKQF